MIYLILAILSSALISILMRISQEKRKSSAGMFIANYTVCILLSSYYMKEFTWTMPKQSLRLVLILGGIAGILFLLSFLLLQINIQKNGVVLAAMFMKLGVIVPIFIAVFAFHEAPKALQVAGILLAIIAIIIINLDSHEKKEQTLSVALLLILLFGSGITDSMINIYDKIGPADFSDHFLFVTFFSALLCSVLLLLIKREKPGIYDFLFGVLIGIPNYFSSRFLLLALSDVPAVVTYPTYSVATIIVVSVVGVICFHEKISKQKTIGLLLVLVALGFLQ